MRQRIAIFYLLIQSSLLSFGQNKQAYLDQYFSTLAKNRQFNGNILVAENGKIVYEHNNYAPGDEIKLYEKLVEISKQSTPKE